MVLSHDLWRKRFASNPAIVGTTVNVNQVPLTIVGVAASGFSGVSVGSRIDAWIPVTMQAELRFMGNAASEDADTRKPWVPQDGVSFLTVIARLPDGPARPAAISGMAHVHRQDVETKARKEPDPDRRQYRLRESLELLPAWRGLSPMRDSYTEPLRVLMATTALVLVIACANLASLLLARGSARTRDLSLRLALGASRGRIM